MAELKYRLIVASPELLVESEGFRKLYANTKFTSKLINVTFDEAHCIVLWGGDDFRPEYKSVHKLRWFIPGHVPFHFVSATMPPSIQEEIKRTFLVKEDETAEIRLSNDRPNIHIQTIEMKHSRVSQKDLRRVLQLDSETPPKPFMVFCNKRKLTEDIARKMWNDLPPEKRDKVLWFHSGMTEEFRATQIDRLRRGELWGIICTDAAGMVCTRLSCCFQLSHYNQRVLTSRTLSSSSNGDTLHQYVYWYNA